MRKSDRNAKRSRAVQSKENVEQYLIRQAEKEGGGKSKNRR